MSCRRAPKRSAVPRVISSASGSASSSREPRRRARRRSARGRASTSSVRSSTASVWPWTSRWWLGPCSTPRSASSSGRTTAVRPSSSSKGDPAQRVGAADEPTQLGELALPGGIGRARRLRPGPARPCPGRAPGRARRRGGRRAAGAAGRRRSCARRRRAAARRSRSARPPKGSIGSPPPSGTATAPIVKSRAARSASIVSPRSAVDVDLPAAVAGDGAPGRELGRELEGVPVALARRSPSPPRAGSPATARSRSVDLAAQRGVAHGAAGDPELRRRSAERPPRQADQRRGGEALGERSCRGPRNPGRDPAGDLVVDRAQPGRRPPRRGSTPPPGRRSGPPRRRARPRSRGRGRPSRCPSRRCRPAGGGGRATSTSALLERPRRTPSP